MNRSYSIVDAMVDSRRQSLRLSFVLLAVAAACLLCAPVHAGGCAVQQIQAVVAQPVYAQPIVAQVVAQPVYQQAIVQQVVAPQVYYQQAVQQVVAQPAYSQAIVQQQVLRQRVQRVRAPVVQRTKTVQRITTR